MKLRSQHVEPGIGNRNPSSEGSQAPRYKDWQLSVYRSSPRPLNSIPRSTILGGRDAALVGLLLGCGLRRSEAVSLRLDQIQLREGHWVVADLYGKGGRLRTAPVPRWCKALIDRWLHASGVSEGLVFRRIWRNKTELIPSKSDLPKQMRTPA
jgi:integrase